MGLFSSLFRSRDAPQNRTAGSGYTFFFGGTTSGKAVTERSAMQMTAVYSCVRILAEAVAGLPLNLYRYTEDGGATWTGLSGDTIVSMNMWGFNRSFLDETWTRFPAFLDKALAENPLKAEYFLPTVVSWLIGEGKARVKVLRSTDKWYGVTYREDKPTVEAAIAEKTASGLYPDRLWEAE